MIQYIDVGIKLEVEPQVYRDGDVGMKLNLEVSNITKTIQSGDSQTGLSSLAYQIGTRSASTSLRVRDGESQILGGLISDEDRRSADKVPGLGQLPLLGRLFSDHNGDHVKTEIVLQITPHIIRPQLAADVDTQEVWSGTDVNVHADQLRLDPVVAAAPVPGAPAMKPGAPALKAPPGNVGGGTVGGASAQAGAAANRSMTVPPTGAFGQLPPAPRTTPPPAPYGGRFGTPSAAPAAPAPSVPPAAEQAGGEAAPGAGASVAPPAAQAPAPAEAAPAPVPTPAPPTLQMPPGDIPNENPLRPIQSGY
jgi:general secretion pathway protein D